MTERTPPRVEGAPGLVWRERTRAKVWVAYWQARSDLVKHGYAPGAKKLWEGAEPDDIDKLEIASQCNDLQSAMLVWGRERDAGGKLVPLVTISNLIDKYQNDDDSAFHKKRYEARQGKAALLKRIDKRFGDVMLSEITGRMILSWYKEWSDGGQKVSAGGAFIATLRTLFRFGAGLLDDHECDRLARTLASQSYKGTRPREVALSADQVVAIRTAAHERGWPFIALAQAIQFECSLRQRDVIGEWVPVKEPGVSDVIQTKTFKGKKTTKKWISGLRWEKIDENLILRHITSKRAKKVEIDLNLGPMVMDEFQIMFGSTERAAMPASGPVILCEVNAWPYYNTEFRRKWRKVATAAGIPKNVKNMDTRSGAITEAAAAGADMEQVRKFATHSNVSQTQNYSRDDAQAAAEVMTLRAARRNKATTD
jgi:integrase